MLSQCQYDKPTSHVSTTFVKQTIFKIGSGRKVFAPSLKILDLHLRPDNDAVFPALVGAYGSVRRIQLKLDGRLVDIWDAQNILPLLIANSGDNEKQRGLNKILYGTGNNVIYNLAGNNLKLDKVGIKKDSSTPVQLKLPVFLDLLNNIGIIESGIEIIIDWQTSARAVFNPVNTTNALTDYSIDAPYLSYETMNGDFKQANNVPYRMWVQEQLNVPAIATDNTLQRYEMRSNAFNNKSIGRIVLVNQPANFGNVGDLTNVYKTFNTFCSIPMKQEVYNVAKDGKLIFSLRNVNNDGAKLASTVDAWGPGVFVSGGHMHLKKPVLDELQADSDIRLNGFCSYGSVEINDHVKKELQISYMRQSDDNTAYPSLGSQLTINAIAEVHCMLVNGQKVYL